VSLVWSRYPNNCRCHVVTFFVSLNYLQSYHRRLSLMISEYRWDSDLWTHKSVSYRAKQGSQNLCHEMPRNANNSRHIVNWCKLARVAKTRR
jgi:hypothetical protein